MWTSSCSAPNWTPPWATATAPGAAAVRSGHDVQDLVIQAQNNLSDERAEFLINDRLSFMRFLGLGLTDKVPDAKTIWRSGGG